jgi:hypothetical protein
MYVMVMAKMPGIINPWRKRHITSMCRLCEVAASTVGTTSANIDTMMTRLRLIRSAKMPSSGAAIATPSVEALTVRPTCAFDAW